MFDLSVYRFIMSSNSSVFGYKATIKLLFSNFLDSSPPTRTFAISIGFRALFSLSVCFVLIVDATLHCIL